MYGFSNPNGYGAKVFTVLSSGANFAGSMALGIGLWRMLKEKKIKRWEFSSLMIDCVPLREYTGREKEYRT